MRMSMFWSSDDPEKVGRYYADYWRSRKLWVRDDITHRGGLVSAVDLSAGKIYQILMSTRGDKTMVFPSVTDNPLGGNQVSAAEAPLRLFPGSTIISSFRTTELSNDAVIFVATNSGTLEETIQFYRQELEISGYQPAFWKKQDFGPRTKVLVHRHPRGDEITISFGQIDKKKVRVHLMRVGS
jgi:hypothetical protein